MPNTVPAAATGLPKMSRRNVVSALAASAAVIAPASASAGENPDAALLALFEEWKQVRAASKAIFDAADEADDAIIKHKRSMPEAAKFKNRPLGRGFHAPSDHQWPELEFLSEGGPNGMRAFDDESYVLMRRAAAHNEWFKDPDMSTTCNDGWIAPYSPPLKARVAEILAAYDPWNAERQRLKRVWDYDAKSAASGEVLDRIDRIERRIAGTRAVTEAGWRAKASIVLHVWRSVADARAEFLEKVTDTSPDGVDSIDLIERSIAFDLYPMEG